MIAIRPPTRDEMAPLAELDRALSGPYSYSAVTFRQFHDLCGPLLAVAVDGGGGGGAGGRTGPAGATGGDLVGFGLVARSHQPADAWFLALAVRTDQQRRGIGRALAAATLTEAVAQGVRTVRLTVDPANAPAVALYTGLGFTVAAEVAGYFEPGDRRLVMAATAERLRAAGLSR